MGLSANGNSARIIDLLEVDGGWLTISAITHDMQARFGVKPDTTRRAINRLIANGTLRTRRRDTGDFNVMYGGRYDIVEVAAP